MKPYISVIIPFYNGERHIGACIEGILSQTYPTDRYEIVMIDNNSTDASAGIVRRYPRITLLSESRQGAYAARNTGVRRARGSILAFMDSDCVPSSGWLAQIDAAMASADADILLGSFQAPPEAFALSMIAAHRHERAAYMLNSEDPSLYFGTGGNMAVRRHIFDALGPFAERPRGSDMIFVLEYVTRYSCHGVRYVSDMAVRHMEVETVWDFYRKIFQYATSTRHLGASIRPRELTHRERMLVFRRTIRRQGYSRAETFLFAGLLALGMLWWKTGVIVGRRLGKG